jgi:tetratricopeptide (TPR) repeat protein
MGLDNRYFFLQRYQDADSAFAKLNEVSPKWPNGYLWRAKANYFLDTLKLELAKPYYDKYVELALEDSANMSKYKSGLIESYKLLADYAFRHGQSIDTINAYFKKVLEIDPADKEALNYFEQNAGLKSNRKRKTKNLPLRNKF